jgi:hypothetical protein
MRVVIGELYPLNMLLSLFWLLVVVEVEEEALVEVEVEEVAVASFLIVLF